MTAPRPFDVGVSVSDVSAHLAVSPIVSIVGFRRSGKSTLAETLARELRAAHHTLITQTASAWCSARDRSATASDASVDPEIVSAMDRLERTPGASCWIVDDAEVLFAYASDQVLASLGDRLGRRQFSLILIRNRFVLEAEGWFRQKQSIVAPDGPTLEMRPLKQRDALQAATAMFDGISRLQQAEWLATMSGGVPGLMSELLPYTPAWPPEDPDPPLLRFAQRRREQLELNKPLRSSLLRALLARVVPPAALLSAAARRELGSLLIAGMVSPDYAAGGDPFQGNFWHLVARGTTGPVSPDPLLAVMQDTALELESFIAKAEMVDDVAEAVGVSPARDGALALAISSSLYCERTASALVQPLAPVLAQILGRYGLLRVYKANGLTPPAGASPAELANHLITAARR